MTFQKWLDTRHGQGHSQESSDAVKSAYEAGFKDGSSGGGDGGSEKKRDGGSEKKRDSSDGGSEKKRPSSGGSSKRDDAPSQKNARRAPLEAAWQCIDYPTGRFGQAAGAQDSTQCTACTRGSYTERLP